MFQSSVDKVIEIPVPQLHPKTAEETQPDQVRKFEFLHFS
jgi:hypothetical protein